MEVDPLELTTGARFPKISGAGDEVLIISFRFWEFQAH